MTAKSIVQKSVVLIAVLAIGFGAFAQQSRNSQNVTLRPTQPTHYLFMPTARVNSPGDLVLGFHEISYAMPGNLQIQASIIDNIGRTCLAAKYGIANNMAIGGGLASTLVNIAWHAIPPSDARLGMFFVYEFENRKEFAMAISPHTQLFGNGFSFGMDFGMRFTPVDFWSFLWEAGSSIDVERGLYLNAICGLRIHPPTVPFLFITVGVAASDFNVSDFNTRARPYFDVMIAFKTGK
jgi:hypothetical protein